MTVPPTLEMEASSSPDPPPSHELSLDARERTLRLVAQVQAGQSGSTEQLVRYMSGRVLGMVLLRMRPELRQRYDPEDVLQEVWIQALSSLSSFDPQRGSPFGAWIATIVRRTLGRLAKQGKVERERPAAEWAASTAVTAIFQREPDQASPSRILSREEQVQRLVEGIQALPAGQREIAQAYWFEGCDAAEIAERVGKTRNAIYVTLVRATRALSKTLKDGSLGDPASWWSL